MAPEGRVGWELYKDTELKPINDYDLGEKKTKSGRKDFKDYGIQWGGFHQKKFPKGDNFAHRC